MGDPIPKVEWQLDPLRPVKLMHHQTPAIGLRHQGKQS